MQGLQKQSGFDINGYPIARGKITQSLFEKVEFRSQQNKTK
jgi:hypothetical protein